MEKTEPLEFKDLVSAMIKTHEQVMKKLDKRRKQLEKIRKEIIND